MMKLKLTLRYLLTIVIFDYIKLYIDLEWLPINCNFNYYLVESENHFLDYIKDNFALILDILSYMI